MQSFDKTPVWSFLEVAVTRSFFIIKYFYKLYQLHSAKIIKPA